MESPVLARVWRRCRAGNRCHDREHHNQPLNTTAEGRSADGQGTGRREFHFIDRFNLKVVIRFRAVKLWQRCLSDTIVAGSSYFPSSRNMSALTFCSEQTLGVIKFVSHFDADRGQLGHRANPQFVKAQTNPDKLFFLTVICATVLVGIFGEGIEGHEWTQRAKPFARFFVGVIMICLGPWTVAMALKARRSEGALSIWSKTWFVSLCFGILLPLGGLAMLSKLLVK